MGDPGPCRTEGAQFVRALWEDAGRRSQCVAGSDEDCWIKSRIP